MSSSQQVGGSYRVPLPLLTSTTLDSKVLERLEAFSQAWRLKSLGDPIETSARGRVLTSIELFESTLDYISEEDCFIMQRVNKKWQRLIQNSVRFQQRILFKSPLHQIPRAGDTMSSVPVKWNPYTMSLGGGGEIQADESRGELDVYILCLKPQGLRKLALDDPTYLLDKATWEPSWKSILVAKPALQGVCMYVNHSWHQEEVIVSGSTKYGGVTLGDISRALCEVEVQICRYKPPEFRDPAWEHNAEKAEYESWLDASIWLSYE